MILAIASGKGGTGKTTVAAALARVWSGACLAVDMDVEAPNLDLFLRSTGTEQRRATIEVPVVAHPELCNGCGACGRLCAFKGILAFGDFPVAFSELCHGCGGCFEVCRRGVLARGERELGVIRLGGGPICTWCGRRACHRGRALTRRRNHESAPDSAGPRDG